MASRATGGATRARSKSLAGRRHRLCSLSVSIYRYSYRYRYIDTPIYTYLVREIPAGAIRLVGRRAVQPEHEAWMYSLCIYLSISIYQSIYLYNMCMYIYIERHTCRGETASRATGGATSARSKSLAGRRHRFI